MGTPMLAVDFFAEVGYFLLYGLAVGMILMVYLVGGVFVRIVTRKYRELCEFLPRPVSPVLVSLILNGGIAALSFVLCTSNGVSIRDVIDSILPFDSFREIIGQFSGGENRFVVNLVLENLGYQLCITVLNFIPFILFELSVQIVCSLTCYEDETLAGTLVQYIIGLIAIGAVNGIVLSSGNSFTYLLLDILGIFTSTADHLFQGNIWVNILILLLGTLFGCSAGYCIIRSTFTNDMLLAFIGVNAYAVIGGANIMSQYTWVFFLIAVLCSLAMKVVRMVIEVDEDFGHTTEAIIGIFSIIVTALVSWGVSALITWFTNLPWLK